MTQLKKQRQIAEYSNSKTKKPLFLRKLKKGSRQGKENVFPILMCWYLSGSLPEARGIPGAHPHTHS